MNLKVWVISVFCFFSLIQSMVAQQWTALKRLTWNPGASESPAIAVDSDNRIHMVWHDWTPGIAEVFHKKSTDGGSNWTTKRLTWTSGRSYRPAIAIDSNDHLHVVWEDETPGIYEIFYKKSTNGGSTWSNAIRLSWNSADSKYPAIGIDSNNHIYVFWEDLSHVTSEIYYSKSINGGVSWTAKRLTWSWNGSHKPSLSIDSNNHIHVVWYDSSPGNYEIFYKKSTNGGLSWTTKRLTWSSNHSYDPDIVIDPSNHIHVVWDDLTPGNREIYYMKSTNGGSSWTKKRLSWNSRTSKEPVIAVDSENHLHIIWIDWTPGNAEIFYKKSSDGGLTWTTKRLTWGSVQAEYPAIAVDSKDNVHVLWDDFKPDNNEIYYKKRIHYIPLPLFSLGAFYNPF